MSAGTTEQEKQPLTSRESSGRRRQTTDRITAETSLRVEGYLDVFSSDDTAFQGKSGFFSVELSADFVKSCSLGAEKRG